MTGDQARRRVVLGWCGGSGGGRVVPPEPRPRTQALVPADWTRAAARRSLAVDGPLPLEQLAARARACTGGDGTTLEAGACGYAFAARAGIVCRARCCGEWRSTPLAELWPVRAARCRRWPEPALPAPDVLAVVPGGTEDEQDHPAGQNDAADHQAGGAFGPGAHGDGQADSGQGTTAQDQ